MERPRWDMSNASPCTFTHVIKGVKKDGIKIAELVHHVLPAGMKDPHPRLFVPAVCNHLLVHLGVRLHNRVRPT